MNKKQLNSILMTSLATILLSGCAASSANKDDVDDKLIRLNKMKKQNEKVVKIDSLYEKERKELLAATIRQPKIPVKTPDKILRVLILPYVDESNNLQTQNYHFVKVDEGKWIIGEYLYGESKASQNSLLTPLD